MHRVTIDNNGADQAPRCPQWDAWSVEKLRESCSRKHIYYREAQAFSTLHGVVVSCGNTLIISIRAELPAPLKIAALAHELAHVYLGHVTGAKPNALRMTQGMLLAFLQDADKEHLANVWAAHLLVEPSVFQSCLDATGAGSDPDERALEAAVTKTVQLLNIPPEVVKLWWVTRSAVFPEAPSKWLQQARREVLPDPDDSAAAIDGGTC